MRIKGQTNLVYIQCFVYANIVYQYKAPAFLSITSFPLLLYLDLNPTNYLNWSLQLITNRLNYVMHYITDLNLPRFAIPELYIQYIFKKIFFFTYSFFVYNANYTEN